MLNVIVPLFIGGIFYVLFRPLSLQYVKVIAQIIDLNRLTDARVFLANLHFPNIILDTLPEFIWAYVVSSGIYLLWYTNSPKYLASLASLFLSLIMEVLQYSQIVPGTFDILDIIASSLAVLLFIYLSND